MAPLRERNVLCRHVMNPPSIKSSRPAPQHASVIPSFCVPEDLDEPTFVEPWRKRVGAPLILPKPVSFK